MGRNSRIRGIAVVLGLVFGLGFGPAAMLAGEAAASPLVKGRFYGIDDAAGAELRVRPSGDGYAGSLRDKEGNAREFTAEPEGAGIETVMEIDGRMTLLRIQPLPYGAEATIVPVAPDGRLLADQARIFAFVRTDIELPEPPKDFIQPPEPGRRVAAYGFLSSYEFWSPSGVRDGYLALAPRHRTLIRLFPAVQLDVIWKLCLAPEADGALGIALRGQGVACAEVRDTIASLQSEGRFGDYKEAVGEEGDVLRQAIRCGDNYVESKSTCDAAAKEVSRMATSLETAATVLNRFR
ncbi:MAG: hypothetical protein AAF074_09380 [Pseudomonadota bacterium]